MVLSDAEWKKRLPPDAYRVLRREYSGQAWYQWPAPLRDRVPVNVTVPACGPEEAHAIVLAAWERGLGTVINGQGIMQSAVVREHAGIPDDQNIMICIAMGYPDESFVANTVKSVREDEANFVRYVGF